MDASVHKVFDRSGVDDSFDVTLKWGDQNPANPGAASFFTELQEQLGLKLESGTAPLQTLVIDHIERPTDN